MKGKKIKIFLFIFIVICSLYSNIVEIISSNRFMRLPSGVNYFLNNVHLKYGLYNVKCDTAKVYHDYNNAELFGNVKIYDNLRSISSRNAKIIRSQADQNHRIYFEKAIFFNQDSIQIKAEEAKFFKKDNLIILTDSVRSLFLQDKPSYLVSEYLSYNYTDNQIFAGRISSLQIVDSARFIDLRTRQIKILQDSEHIFIDRPFELKMYNIVSDDLIQQFMSSNRSFDFNEFLFKKVFNSIEQEAFLSGNKALYKDENLEIIGNVNFWQKNEDNNDSLIVKSDSAYYYSKNKELRLLGNVEFLKDTLKAVSNKAIYYENEKKMVLFDEPKLLINKDFAKGDTIKIRMEDNYPKYLEIINNVYIENRVGNNNKTEDKLLNKLRGRYCKIFFENKKIDKMIVAKEASAIYYLDNSSGSNYITGDTLKIDFFNNTISAIEMIGGSRGVYYPEHLKHKADK